MLDKKDLDKCIGILAELNATVTNTKHKQWILEVGYILKQELDNVIKWNQQFKGDRVRGHQIDVQKLLEDNTQLFNENRKLQEANLKLKEVIDKRIPQVEHAIASINSKFDSFSDLLNKF